MGMMILEAQQELTDQSRHLATYVTPWSPTQLLAFLKRAGKEPRFFWENGKDELAFAGFGVVKRIESDSLTPFLCLQEKLSTIQVTRIAHGLNIPAWALPKWIGLGRFDPAYPQPDESWAGFPAAVLILPRVLVTRQNDQYWIAITAELDPGCSEGEILEQLQEELWDLPLPIDLHMPGAELPVGDEFVEERSFSDWERAVLDAVFHINRGDFNKAVLSHGRELVTRGFPNILLVLDRLGVHYPDCYRFLFEPGNGAAFFGASPELLVKVQGKAVETMALAGSLQRGATRKEDQQLGKVLFASEKNRQEHFLVVEQIKASLAPYLEDLDVEPAPHLMVLNNIQHLCTRIEGKLHNSGNILQVVQALHPTPAVGGAPRDPAVSFIREAEGYDRGAYAGPIGWVDMEGNGVFAVALRSGLYARNKVRVFAGAGIVEGSDPAKEWAETGWKFKAIQEAFLGW